MSSKVTVILVLKLKPPRLRTMKTRMNPKIAVHEAAIRELRTRHNIYSPVSKLPTEILAKIFISLRWTMNTFKIGAICHTWREISVNTSEAWNTINVSKITTLDHAVTMLKRAEQAPLYVDCLRAPSSEGLRFVISQIGRIRDLNIDMRNLRDSLASLESGGSEAEKKCLPVMQRLVLQGEIGPGIETTAVLKGVFGMNMPSLHTLELHNISLPSVEVFPLFPLLQKLTITGIFSISTILTLLRCTPAVTKLKIRNISPPHPHEAHNHVESVNLPHLSLLSLTTVHFVDIACLIQRIRCPSSVCVRLESDEAPCHMDHVGILSAALSHFAQSESAARADHMWLLHSSQLPGFQLGTSTGNTILFAIHCQIRAPVDMVSSLSDLHQSLPSRQVRALRVGGLVGLCGTKRWKDLFRHHQKVETLLLELQTKSYVFQALADTVGGEDAEQQQSGCLLPQLLNIELRGCIFDKRTSQLPLTSSFVCEFLQQRIDLGIPLNTLKIRQCEISSSTVESLAKMIEVDWDEKTRSA